MLISSVYSNLRVDKEEFNSTLKILACVEKLHNLELVDRENTVFMKILHSNGRG